MTLLSSNVRRLRSFSSAVLPHVLKVGDVLRQKTIFSSEDVSAYAKVSHDINPVHFDPQAAQDAGFDDRLVHGLLVAALFPRIISSNFPGAVYASQSLRFKLPVYVGEEISGEVQATDIRGNRNKYIAKFSTKCFKNNDLLVLDGEAIAILPILSLKPEPSA